MYYTIDLINKKSLLLYQIPQPYREVDLVSPVYCAVSSSASMFHCKHISISVSAHLYSLPSASVSDQTKCGRF